MGRDEELAKQGWERRTTIDEPRLSEVVAEYEALGFEVRLEPVEPADTGDGNEADCRVCFDTPGAAERFRTVYTRPVDQTKRTRK